MRVVVRCAISIVCALLTAAVFANMGAAGAVVARDGNVVVRVAPTSRVADGQAVDITAVSAKGVSIYQIQAHLCTYGNSIRTNFDFGFQGQRCVNVALGHGDVEQTIEYGGGVNAGNLDTFKVGAGSVRWVNELGYDQVIDCGPGHPCDLAIRVQITDNTLFFSVPLCYGPTCPPEPADPVVLIPTPTTTTTTVHPPANLTTPTAPKVGAVVGSSRSGGAGTGSAASERVGAPNPKPAAISRPAAAATAPAVSAGAAAAATPGTHSADDPPADHGMSEGARVAWAALAGAIGSAWLVSIILRGSGLVVPLLQGVRRRRFSPATSL